MRTHEKIEYALRATLQAHPGSTTSIACALYDNIVRENGQIRLNNFTKSNNARQMMTTVNQNDLMEYIIDECIKIYNSAITFYQTDRRVQSLPSEDAKYNRLIEVFPIYPQVYNLINKIADDEVNAFIYLQSQKKELFEFTNLVARYKLDSKFYREFINEHGNSKTALNGYREVDLFAKVKEDRRKVEVGRNLQVNQSTLNKCYEDVLNGAQLRRNHNEYGLDGDLFATQDIGKKRTNQEDSAIILTRPDAPNIKLLAVADGMGGADYGEIASNYTLKTLSEWFLQAPLAMYYQPLEVQDNLNSQIESISGDIYQKYNLPYNKIKAGTTLSIAIITENETILSTIGDSRAYITGPDGFRLITQDETIAWPARRNLLTVKESELDDMKFNVDSNIITRCIGEPILRSNIQTLMLPNEAYDRLVICTDGVTDLLSQEKIRFISENSPRNEITNQLVNEAMTYNAIREKGADEHHVGIIKAGKDNATAVAFARR